MQSERKYCLWLFIVALFCFECLSAQDSGAGRPDAVKNSQANNEEVSSAIGPSEQPFTVRNIFIEGNRKTRNNIILREITFKSGDQYLLQELVKKFERARQQLMNTTLFHEVTVALKSFDGYNVDVLVIVKERWYIFPVPYFKPVDRNLNQWIVEQKASLSRVNYGAKLLYNNVTGRNDKLKFWLFNGYTRQVSISYDRPYIDKSMKWGLNLSVALGKNRELNINTIDDKQVFFKDRDNYIRNFFRSSAELTYRPAIKTKHTFGVAYSTEEVGDTVISLNPAYFKSGRKRIAFPEIYYNLSYYDLDYIPYPTKGYAGEVSIAKTGINNIVNVWQLSAKGSGNWHTGKKTFFSLNAYGTVKLPLRQPYFNQRFLGYSDAFMQGYEYYVVDGVAGGYLKAALTKRLFNFHIKTPATKKRESFRIPINIYGKIYGNAGYVHNPQPGANYLSNQMLYSGGFGIDIITIYDFTIKLEWSFNQLGQNGLFLHRKTLF
jgi:outer membrane protein assembly factor BamA